MIPGFFHLIDPNTRRQKDRLKCKRGEGRQVHASTGHRTFGIARFGTSVNFHNAPVHEPRGENRPTSSCQNIEVDTGLKL